MPLPKRYISDIEKINRIWEPEGYFYAQVKIWEKECEARHEIYNEPNAKQLSEIKKALKITPSEVESLTHASGHETNKLLRLVQGRKGLSREASNFIHKGNTSSDILDTSLALQMRESIKILEEDLNKLLQELKKLAVKHKKTIQVARSHGQHAIPQVFGRQVLGWYAEVERGAERLERAREVISYGKLSGEIGTNVFIDPKVEELTLKKLGLKVDPAPTQVISRDRHAEVLSELAVITGTIDRIAVNIRLLSITDLGEVREPFDEISQQGSSAMPHKRNPELSERINGIVRRIRSTALEEMNAQSLWLERDISHSSTERFSIPDAFGGLDYVINLATLIIKELVVYEKKMLENLNSTNGAIYSSRLLNRLIESGMGRTEAYELVKSLTHKAMEERVDMLKLALTEKQLLAVISKEEIKELLKPDFYLRNLGIAYSRVGIK